MLIEKVINNNPTVFIVSRVLVRDFAGCIKGVGVPYGRFQCGSGMVAEGVELRAGFSVLRARVMEVKTESDSQPLI